MAKPNNDYNLKQNELNSKNNNNLGITSFCNFRKKGFTLIEIMAIIILLSVISIIIYPVINNTISKSEDDLYDQQIEELVRLSNAWVAGNAIDLVPKEGFTYDLTFEELATQGYIVEKDIINPKTGEVFPGCMKVTYNSVDSNYNVSYDEACEAETGDVTPIINLVVDEGVINSAGYAVRDFNVKVLGSNIASYKYCTGTRECEPIVSVNGNSGNIAITNEGITYVCVIGKKGSKTTKKLCKSYKLDKSDFVMGELVIDGTLGENGWYTSDVKLSVRDVEGVTSKLNINSITENTKGTEVILTSTSKSGKTGTKKYTVKVDKTAPVAGTLNVIGTKGGNGWFLSDVVFIVNNGSDNLSGHASTTSTHTSITSNTTGTEVIVTTKDKAGNTSTRSYVIKVNKSIPAAGELVIDGTLGENGWYTSDVNLSVKDEVGVTSTLNINKINYDTAGTEIIMTSINNLTGASKTTKYTIKVDKTKPIVGELVISGVKGDNDWYKGDVTFSVKNGSDSMSGHSKTTSSITSITKDTKGTKVVVTTKDKAGNTNTKEYIVKMDKTAPVAGTLTISGTKGSGDWYLSDVTFTINDGSDATSGHAKTTSTHTSVSGNTSGTVVTVTTTDKAGNSATKTYTIKVDKTKPTITAKGTSFEIEKGTNKNSSTYFNTPKFGISGGSMNCSPATTGSLSSGTHTLTCTATGGNGNQAKATVSLVVKAMYADGSGANIPELYKNMVPIKYENNRWIVADLYSKWYDYNAKQWANAVVLNPGLTKAVGQEVTEEEVSLWYVWLPRYKYTVFNGNNGSVSEQLINVTFESGTNSTGTVKCTDNFSTNGKSEVCTDSTNGSIKNGISTYTHPAFTFGNTALKGIWIGKFELSATDSSCINDGTNIQCNKVLTIVTKPNVRSWMKAETVNFFTSIKNAATTYGISNADSHMIKNMEWGAAAYLKQSKYGLGNTIMKTNSNSSCYTGGGTGDAYKTNVMQSTTGNVYGVYDMSGGCFEYVMGFELNSNNQFNTAKSSFTTEPNFKYYDKYKYESVDYPQGALTFSRGKLGDATKETLKKYGVREGGWNGEIATFPYRSNLTFIRGGCYEDASNGVNIKAGIFYFTYTPVYAMNFHTTRAVLTAQ